MRARLASLVICVSIAFGPAVASASTGGYRFEIAKPVERTESGTVLTIRLLDVGGDRVIADADVFRRQMDLRHKAIPAIGERRTSLQPDGNGNYRLVTPYALTPGSTIKLGAYVTGLSGTVRGSVDVPR
jgi:hypothetical protein